MHSATLSLERRCHDNTTDNMAAYEIYYIDRQFRIECMLACSLNGNIDWNEEGMQMASWKYNFICRGKGDDLDGIFRKHSELNFDRRRRVNHRSMNLGDVIVLDGEPWIVCAFGFSRVPQVLWREAAVESVDSSRGKPAKQTKGNT